MFKNCTLNLGLLGREGGWGSWTTREMACVWRRSPGWQEKGRLEHTNWGRDHSVMSDTSLLRLLIGLLHPPLFQRWRWYCDFKHSVANSPAVPDPGNPIASQASPHIQQHWNLTKPCLLPLPSTNLPSPHAAQAQAQREHPGKHNHSRIHA